MICHLFLPHCPTTILTYFCCAGITIKSELKANYANAQPVREEFAIH
jgi:hypothetical protein